VRRYWAAVRGSLAEARSEAPRGCANVILATAAGCLLVGAGALAAWRITGNYAWVREFFYVPAALLMVWLAAVQVWLSAVARRHFAPGEPMRRVWTLAGLAAVANVGAAVGVQVLAVESQINVLGRLPGWSGAWAEGMRDWGHLLGGPVRFLLLAAGLWFALAAYRRAGFPGRLRGVDWLPLAAFAVYLGRNVYDVAAAARAGGKVGWVKAANWPTDPALLALLAIALLLYRSVEQTGGGWIGRCWRAFSFGVFLTALGNVGTWADAYGYLGDPWNSLVWFLWLPAEACFAAAPAYQLEAIRFAREGAGRSSYSTM
jgi:hypothetical protein